MTPSTSDAVAASIAVAAALDLPTQHPVVVAEGYSVRVRLDPAPVLTRVVTAGQILRGDPLPWMQREIAVTEFLTAAGAPVVPAWPDPGPHHARGLSVSLWQWVDPDPESRGLPPRTYGRLLKDLHDDLADYQADLPVLAGPLTDIASAMRLSDHRLLTRRPSGCSPWP